MDSNITFVIFTYNEEKRIEGIIRNYKDFGKILIADYRSTDATQQIATSYGCDIFLRDPEPFFFPENEDMINRIYKHVTTDWVYIGYADDMMEKKTLQKICEIVKQDKHDIIKVNRKNYFYGEFCNDLYESAGNRFFKKGAIDFKDNKLHTMGKVVVDEKRIYKLSKEYCIHQFIDYTAASHVNATNKYTDTELRFPHKSNTSVWFFIFTVAKNLIKNYFIQGLKLGFPALALTELSLTYELVRNIKFYEHENNITKASIEAKNDGHRARILAGIEGSKSEKA